MVSDYLKCRQDCRRQVGGDAPMLKCYRIWFDDGSAILRDAESKLDANRQGVQYLKDTGQSIRVATVECLTN